MFWQGNLCFPVEMLSLQNLYQWFLNNLPWQRHVIREMSRPKWLKDLKAKRIAVQNFWEKLTWEKGLLRRNAQLVSKIMVILTSNDNMLC
jgi:hypothetical protein